MSVGVPGPVARFTTLFFTPAYLLLLAAILARVSDIMMIVATAIVFAGAAIICLLMTMFCSRLANMEDSNTRFSIDMLMMVTAVLAIFFGYINQIYQNSYLRNEQAPFFLASFVFIGWTTIILLRFTDSLIELIKIFVRLVWYKADRQS